MIRIRYVAYALLKVHRYHIKMSAAHCKCTILSSSTWQKGQLFLWMRILSVSHVTRQFKSTRNRGNICLISGLRICMIWRHKSTQSFNDDSTCKRRIFIIVEWTVYEKLVRQQFGAFIHISRKPFLHNVYCIPVFQSWLVIFASRNIHFIFKWKTSRFVHIRSSTLFHIYSLCASIFNHIHRSFTKSIVTLLRARFGLYPPNYQKWYAVIRNKNFLWAWN